MNTYVSITAPDRDWDAWRDDFDDDCTCADCLAQRPNPLLLLARVEEETSAGCGDRENGAAGSTQAA